MTHAKCRLMNIFPELPNIARERTSVLREGLASRISGNVPMTVIPSGTTEGSDLVGRNFSFVGLR